MKTARSILLGFTALFLCLCIGIFIGRNTSGSYLLMPDPQSFETTLPSLSDGKMDINTASAHQLSMLPGIGETIAQRIVAYRTANGDFSDIEILLKVDGIGPKKLDAIRSYITAGGQ